MKYAFQILICAALLVACKNETAKTPSAPGAPVEASAILKHKYWGLEITNMRATYVKVRE